MRFQIVGLILRQHACTPDYKRYFTPKKLDASARRLGCDSK